MCDALQELSELRFYLQDRDMEIRKLKYWYKFLKKEDRTLGPIINALLLLYMIFAFVEFYFTKMIQEMILPLSKDILYKIEKATEKRLLDSQDEQLANWSRILDQKHCPKDIKTQLTLGEVEIRNLSVKLLDHP